MHNTRYQAVFGDIDGTLLNRNHQIGTRTQHSIRRILALGVPFILVSARPPLAITPFSRQLQCRSPIICYSGALVLDDDLSPLHSLAIGQPALTQLEQTLARLAADALPPDSRLSINHYAGLHWYADPDNPWTQQEAAITGLQPSPRAAELTEVHKILLMSEAAEIRQLEHALRLHFPQLHIHRSKNEYLEITHQQASKSQAIRFLEKRLGLDPQRIIAFGDNFNDLDMLQHAGLSVAMGNAPDDIKAAAHRVTATNDEDGIALVLDEVFPENDAPETDASEENESK